MIEVSAAARSVIDAGSFVYALRASSWLGDELLADDIPVSAGGEDGDRSLTVPDRVVLTVPKTDGVTLWSPAAADDALAAAGQTIKVSLGVGIGNDGFEWFQRGEFLVVETRDDGDALMVTCASLLYLIDEAKFVSPFQPTGTIAATVRALVEPALTVDLAMAPDDRSVPTSAVNWDSDRMGALAELLDAWPADFRMNAGGYLEVIPDAVPTVAVRAFTDQAGGTVIRADGTSTRDGGFNVVVATGYAADGGEVRGVATIGSGPWAYGSGEANPLPVPYGYSSPLLTTNAQCIAAATTVLRRKMREAALKRYTIDAVPDPTLQLGDAVTVTTDAVAGLLCTVEALSLPYTPDGAMRLTVVSTT